MDILKSIAEFFGLREILILALIFVPLERVFALYADRKLLRKHLSTDLIYLFFVGHLVRLGNMTVVILVLVAVDSLVPSGVHQAVQSQHWLLQLVEIMLLADIFQYLAHRAFHAVPFLWRFHSVHHSSEELDWLSAYRVHPIDQIATKFVSLLPVFALGYSFETLAVFFVIQQFHALLVHANIRLNLGPLNWVLVTPQFHHWHHANEKSAYDKNFAAQFPLIDWIGGTMNLPENRYPQRYGADDAPPSNNVVRQLIDPLLPPAMVSRPAPRIDDSAPDTPPLPQQR